MGQVKLLELIHCPPSGPPNAQDGAPKCISVFQHAPSWAEIETAVRRLDRAVYPYLWLHLAEPVPGEEPVGSNVMGGKGEFALSISLPDSLIYYSDLSRGDKIILNWETDLGSLLPESSLCAVQDRVLAIVRHFVQTGCPNPTAEWRE